jgi:hypothetical protein
MAVSKLNPSAGGVPYGNNAGRPANPSIGRLYSNGEAGRLELYTSTGWQNIVQETPGVASATGHYYQSDNYGVLTISGTNFTDGAIAYAVGTNAISYQATTTTFNSIVQLTARFDNLSAAYEPYDIKVLNPSNLFGILPDAFFINESPVWATTAGSLGSIITGQVVSIQLSSTDAESDSRTYALSSGSLPAGLSLSSSGLISGTASGTTSQTFTFTVTVSDGFNALVSRSFSIAYSSVSILSGGTLASDATYYYRTFTGNGTLSVSNASLSVDYLVVAGGGAGGNYTNNTGGGGGAGGLRSTVGNTGGGGALESPLTLSAGSYSITVGAGGTTNGTSQVIGGSGTDSTFSTVTSKGGSGGGSAAQGGSGGGGNLQTANGGYGSGGAGTTGQGFAGGNGIATSSDAGGGGGGAGGAGTTGQNAIGGNAGNGVLISSLATPTSTGASGYYAGGGGGGVYNGTTYGTGGLGGGGRGGYATTAPVAGTANTGGGGGGSGTGNNPVAGGSGIVIVRYLKSAVGG